MADIEHLCKSEASKMAPFYVCVIAYFAFVRDPHGEAWTTILKCAPIVSLAFFVILRGLTSMKQYSQLIFLGLIFSCGGDALLNIDLFPHGMGSFALAQICYVLAFGFKPFKWSIAIALYLPGAAFVATVFKDLNGVLSVGFPVYVFLLLLMCWRSLARAVDDISFLTIFCAIGSIFFVISDTLIGVDMFLVKVPNARLWIMLTYYLAQYAITLSTVNDGAKKKPAKYAKDRRNSAS